MRACDDDALAALMLQRDDDGDVSLAESPRDLLSVVFIFQDEVIVLNSLFIDYAELVTVGDDLSINAAAIDHLVFKSECLEPVAIELLEVVDLLEAEDIRHVVFDLHHYTLSAVVPVLRHSQIVVVTVRVVTQRILMRQDVVGDDLDPCGRVIKTFGANLAPFTLREPNGSGL